MSTSDADVSALLKENEKLRKRVEELEKEKSGWPSFGGSFRGLDINGSFDMNSSGHSLSSDVSCSKWHGLRARPEFAKRVCAMKKRRAKEKSDMRIIEENAQLLESYGVSSSSVAEVLNQCQGLHWPKDVEYLPLAKLLNNAAIPKCTFEELVTAMDMHPKPLILRMEHGTLERRADHDADTPISVCVDDIRAEKVNPAAEEVFGDVDKVSSWERINEKSMRWKTLIEQAIIEAIFEDGDVQPFREIFFKFGKLDTDEWNPADVMIMQMTPLLVERSNKVYFALIDEAFAPLKYPREIMDRLLGSAAIFRYTQICLVVFSMEGVILQQNPASMEHFGIVASANTTFYDTESDGVTPFNRLRALFGDNQIQYEKMWNAVNNPLKGNAWKAKVKIYNKDLRPHKRSDVMSTFEMEDYKWWAMYVHKYRDPATGQFVISLDLKDITESVEKDEMLKEMRQHEHNILRSIIPDHVLDFLVEEKRANELKAAASSKYNSSGSFASTRSSSTSSTRSEMLLSLSGVQDMTDNRVATLAEHHEDVTILFTDIVGFTKMAAKCSPADVMIMLNKLFTIFDSETENHSIYKVETIGDAYMCAAGLNLKSEREKLDEVTKLNVNACTGTMACPKFHACRMLGFAQAILEHCKDFETPTGHALQIRIGMHSGDCMTGIVGVKMPRFCLFGDSVNTASRMESKGVPGKIHVSKATRDLLPQANWKATGGVEAKGKGVMETFLLDPILH